MKKLLMILVMVSWCGVSYAGILPDESPSKQYEFATSLLKVKDYDKAEKAFKEFVDTNPNHELAGSAQYWYAETFRIREYFLKAAEEYLRGYNKYPKSDKAPVNLLKFGMALVYIGEWDQGCSMIKGVKKQYRKARKAVLQKAKNEFEKMCLDSSQKSKWVKKGRKYPADEPEISAKKPETDCEKIKESLQAKFKKEEEKLKREEIYLISQINLMKREEFDRRAEDLKKRADEYRKRKAAAFKEYEDCEEDIKTADNQKIIIIGSGSGFFVSNRGHIVSNDHVVGVCKKVKAYEEGEEIFLNILATDMVNDIGLVKGKFNNKKYLNIKTDGAELGEDIVVFGYPLSQTLSDSVKLTKGIVSSLTGLGNNISQIQIDAAIQPGNSGGPVLNMSGQVVGIASAGLSKLYMAKEKQILPENVNFAVASQTLTAFLKAHKVKVISGPSKTYSSKDLAKIGEPATIQLFCMNTMAAYEKLKKAETHADVLLDLN